MTAKVFWPIFTILMTVLLALLWYVGWNVFYFENHLPDSGQWWCEELQLMLSFDDGVDGYYVDDGQTKPCFWWAEHRSNDIYVELQDTQQELNMVDHRTVIFSGWSVKCTDRRMIVQEHDTRVRYTFVLVDQNTANGHLGVDG